MSRDRCVALSCGAMDLSAVCDCGISRSYSFTIFGECSGSVKECLTRDRGAVGLSLTDVTASCH